MRPRHPYVGRRVIQNIPGTAYDRDMPALQRYGREQMKSDSVWLHSRYAAA